MKADLITKNLARRSCNQNSEYLAQRRKGRKESVLSFRPKGEIFLRSLAFARDDRPCPSLGVLGVPSTLLRTDLARANPRFWIAMGHRKICASCEQEKNSYLWRSE